MSIELNKIFRCIPSIDSLLNEKRIQDAIKDFGRGYVTMHLKKIVQAVRDDVQKIAENKKIENELLKQVENLVQKENIINKALKALTVDIRLRKVVNVSGVILHTGLGRAPFDEKILEKALKIHSNYSLLEVDEKSNERVERERYVREILCEITGSEWALVVNNNASATFLILSTFAKGKEVIVNRGELVEIGGQFRLPLILQSAGAILKEVGTTNKSYIEDYEEAITKDTALILKVHTSNYRMTGFVEHPEISQLILLSKKYSIPFVYDIGSGALFDCVRYGLPDEPTVSECVREGVDIFCFSGDKLLGGPQAGIILGKKSFLTKLRKNPIYRIMRVDKLTLSILEATLYRYLDEDYIKKMPVYKMMFLSDEEIESRIKILQKKLEKIKSVEMIIKEGESEIGGGSLPDYKIRTKLLCIKFKDIGANEMLEKLRLNEPPIFAIASDDYVAFNTRTMINPEDEAEIIYEAIKKL